MNPPIFFTTRLFQWGIKGALSEHSPNPHDQQTTNKPDKQLWQSCTQGPCPNILSQNDTTEQNKTETSKIWQSYTNCGISSSRSSNCCIRFSRGLWQVGVPSGRPGSSELSLGWPLVCTGQANVASKSGSDFATWLWGACTRTGGTAAEGNAVFSSVPLTLKVGLGGL